MSKMHKSNVEKAYRSILTDLRHRERRRTINPKFVMLQCQQKEHYFIDGNESPYEKTWNGRLRAVHHTGSSYLLQKQCM